MSNRGALSSHPIAMKTTPHHYGLYYGCGEIFCVLNHLRLSYLILSYVFKFEIHISNSATVIWLVNIGFVLLIVAAVGV